jgi:TolB-like protein
MLVHTPTKNPIGKIALFILAASFLLSCSGSPDARRNNLEDPPSILRRDEIKSAIAEAMALSLAGDTEQALNKVGVALRSARDAVMRAGALEAKAWAMLFSGSREEALEAFRDADALDAPPSPGRAVLEFRLAAAESIAAARKLVAESMSGQDLGERAALAIAVMVGEKDLRDVAIDSPEAATEYSTYLAGYSLAPEIPTATATGSMKDGPVIVVSRPESIGADEATAAVVHLACRDALARRNRFRVVDVDSRKAAMDELELSLSGAAAGEKDKATGDLFAADYVVSGSVVKIEAGWLVAFSLSSAEDGHIVASDFSMATDHAAILSAAARFASTLDSLAGSGS